MTADRAPHEHGREPVVRPHETREFTNSVEYTIQLTFVVAGGARWRTAYDRARKVAERLANTAARTKGVVDVRAVAGASRDGELIGPERVRFSAANSGHGTYTEPDKLDRYLDPEHERALASLAEANAAQRHRRQADRDRRRAVGCANPSQLVAGLARACGCVYCRPAAHLAYHLDAAAGPPNGGCLCGRDTPAPAGRCAAHQAHELVVLDGDPGELSRLAALRLRRSRPEAPDRSHEGPRDPELPPDRGRDGPPDLGMPPPGR